MSYMKTHDVTRYEGRVSSRYFSIFIVLSLGLFVSGILFITARGLEEQRIYAEFETAAANRLNELDHIMETGVWHGLHGFEALFKASEKVERDEFQRGAGILLGDFRKKTIQAFIWAPRVGSEEREVYEKSAREEGFEDFQITEETGEREIVRASPRREYFPVYYLAPYHGNEEIMGLDLASADIRKDAMRKARDTGEMTAVEWTSASGQENRRKNLIVFTPVYKKGMRKDTVKRRRAALEGFIVGAYDIKVIADMSFRPFRNNVRMFLFDLSAPKGRQFIYSHSHVEGYGVSEPVNFRDIIRLKGPLFMRMINVADRKWMALFTPTAEFMEDRETWQPYMILIGGVAVVGFTTVYIWLLLASETRSRIFATELLSGKARLEAEVEERKKAEDDLRKFFALTENSGDFIGMAGLDGHVFYLNGAGKKLVGLGTDEEVMTKKMEDFVTEEGAKTLFDKALPTVSEKGRWWGEEKVRNFKTGRFIDAHINMFIVRAPNGRPLCFGCVLRDVTQRKKDEAELRGINERLERTLEDLRLTQSHLIRSAKLASLGALSAGVAHEIKNPLNIISSSIQLMMMEDGVTDEKMEMYRTIMQQVKRTVKIIENLRDFARERKPEIKTVDLHEFLNKTIALVEYEMKVENNMIVKNFFRAPLHVLGDADQLAQVFLNIINNARDSMNEKRELAKSARGDLPNNQTLTITTGVNGENAFIKFEDTGMGISEEAKIRMFDPFYTTKDKGTGLGMAITFRIIEEHSGSINIDGEQGKGCALTVTLPLVK